MALIKCKECEKKFSDQAFTCPHCGAPFGESERMQIQKEADENSAKLGRVAIGITIFFVFTILLSAIIPNNGRVTSATVTPVDPVASQFIGDEHIGLRELIKKGMHNPDSYEFVSGRRWQNDGKIFAEITYRGTNGFGGIVTEEVQATLDGSGNVMSISR